MSKKMPTKKFSFQKTIINLKENWFLISTLVGVVIGGVFGYVLRPYRLSADTVLLLSYPGELYMRALKLMVLPFVAVCIVTGTATLNVNKNGMIAVRTAVYFFSTTLMSTCIALILAVLIHPGSYSIKFTSVLNDATPRGTPLDNFLDIGRNIIPENIFSSTIESTITKYIPNSNGTYIRTISSRPGTNMLGIVIFFLLFGSILGGLGSKKQLVIDFFSVLYEILLTILLRVVRFTPIAVGSIICCKVYQVPDLGETMSQLMWFILTVLAGLIFHQLVLIQIIYFAVIGSNPFAYYKKLMPIILTGFATSSKSASMSVSFDILENKLCKNRRIVRFVLPLGSLNLNGTGIFMATALVFIAQINNISLGLPDLVSLLITISVMSMSLATVPSASLVAIVMLCSQINAPVEDVSLLFTIDWFLDRCRTINNITGDCYAVAVLQQLSENELKHFEKENDVQRSMMSHLVENTNDCVETSDQSGDPESSVI